MPREMKDSGIEWIGKIPTHWSISKMKYIGQYINGYAFKPEDWGSVGKRIIRIQDLTRYNDNPNYYDGEIDSKYLIKAGDILVSWAATLDAFVWEYEEGWLNQHIFKALPNYNLVDCDYFYWLIKEAMHNMSNENLHGIMMQHVTLGLFGNYAIPLPPISEQKAIADFLDKQCTEIDAVIEKTKATIEEYKKLKQSVITEAVTKGIRGDRPMKDSSIEWIESIVDTWKISRIGLHFDIILGKMLCDKQINDDYSLEPYFCAANVHFDGVSQNGLKQMWFSPAEKLSYAVNNGDLLVVEGGAGAGGCAIVENLTTPTYVQNSVMIVRNNRNNDNRFLRYWIEMLVKKGYVDVVCNKATIPHFTKDKLSTMPFPVLDSQEEIEISDYLDKKCAEIDTLIAKKTALLEEMETYKKSVIYEYVTGKKEVL